MVKLDYFQYYLERIDGVLKNRGDGVGGWGGLVLREGDMFGENIFSNIFFVKHPTEHIWGIIRIANVPDLKLG